MDTSNIILFLEVTNFSTLNSFFGRGSFPGPWLRLHAFFPNGPCKNYQMPPNTAPSPTLSGTSWNVTKEVTRGYRFYCLRKNLRRDHVATDDGYVSAGFLVFSIGRLLGFCQAVAIARSKHDSSSPSPGCQYIGAHLIFSVERLSSVEAEAITFSRPTPPCTQPGGNTQFTTMV